MSQSRHEEQNTYWNLILNNPSSHDCLVPDDSVILLSFTKGQAPNLLVAETYCSQKITYIALLPKAQAVQLIGLSFKETITSIPYLTVDARLHLKFSEEAWKAAETILLWSVRFYVYVCPNDQLLLCITLYLFMSQ